MTTLVARVNVSDMGIWLAKISVREDKTKKRPSTINQYTHVQVPARFTPTLDTARSIQGSSATLVSFPHYVVVKSNKPPLAGFDRRRHVFARNN